ncbi:unnamed protein product [Schistocephalus solidus]|uniref:glycylpeptide N-tetradecanoyltransferase n=1 Tax=Schistocephalus solidus TaxID=70667 RepID=A0A183TBR4_SCHSO|nr:unnamed protein product [Schistocephalus solidus]
MDTDEMVTGDSYRLKDTLALDLDCVASGMGFIQYAQKNNSKPSADVRNNVNVPDQPSKNASSNDAAAASPPVIDDAKMHEMEAHLMKQLTSVMLTSPRNLSTLTPSKPAKKSKEDYKFWKTQPVPDLGEEITTNEPVEPDIPISEIRTEPYSLPKGFFWQDLDLNNPSQLQELYDLLNENYVEDDDHLFRFAYAKEFLKCDGRLIPKVQAPPPCLAEPRRARFLVDLFDASNSAG